ncbi:HAMP domain-containing methyl-accepting chemotaxis protein [Hoeflea sp. BAL378]|uniref:HAMP domain-containing methyl-accepting chemotaxis protein n=1 Tax=Hoeflea sp. BAL378 TaxID=1547437 RepID=UPI00068D560C|nr:HAMP domain-containing methyl-accepting chemotaxis protein [Hoeflea sp. BAL378]
MKRPSIKLSLVAVFGLIVAICSVTGYVAIHGLTQTNDATTEIATNWLPSVKIVNVINTATSDYRIAEGAHILSTTPEQIAKAEGEIEAVAAQIAAARTTYEGLISSEGERQVYDRFSKEWATYGTLHTQLIDLSRQNKNEEATILFKGELRDVYDSASAHLVELININDAGANDAYVNSASAYGTTRTITFVTLGLTGLILAGAMYFVLAGVAAPITRITASMRDLAAGDTDKAIPFAGRADEIGAMAGAVEVFRQAALTNKRLEAEAESSRKQAELTRLADQERAEAEAAERMRQATAGLAAGLKRLAAGDLSFQLTEAFAADFEGLRQDFNTSIVQLAHTLTAVSQSIGSITNGSQEISSGTNDLSKRTEQQAAALEETAAALDEITVNVSNSSKRSEEARQVATEANASAARSGEVVSRAVAAMNRIEGSSNQISNIIGVIDEIAFQTNLLALNAGVEAARAGEAGRGFAVVAQEVRELAQRSAKAAKEIKGLIETSTHEVSEGVQLVTETGTALKSIGDVIVVINSHMEAIATSSREQSTGLAEVNTAVNQLDQTTQQNAAMVEQSSAAASTLANEADTLRQLISQFNLGTGSAQAQTQSQALRQTAARMSAPSSRVSSRPSPAPLKVASGGAAQGWDEF